MNDDNVDDGFLLLSVVIVFDRLIIDIIDS